MDIVISNNKAPLQLVDSYVVKDLNYISNASLEELYANVIFFDVDLVTEQVYKTVIKRLIDAHIMVRFYYNTPAYINDDIIINKTSSKHSTPSFKLSDNITVGLYTDEEINYKASFILSCGSNILRYIKKQLIYNNCDVEYIEPSEYHDQDIVSVALNKILSAQNLMFARLKQMEKEQVNNYKKLSTNEKEKFIIIKDYSDFITQGPYIRGTNLDNFNSAIESIARFGAAAGVMILLGCDNIEELPANFINYASIKIIGEGYSSLEEKLKLLAPELITIKNIEYNQAIFKTNDYTSIIDIDYEYDYGDNDDDDDDDDDD